MHKDNSLCILNRFVIRRQIIMHTFEKSKSMHVYAYLPIRWDISLTVLLLDNASYTWGQY